jgi:hypothetical protein
VAPLLVMVLVGLSITLTLGGSMSSASYPKGASETASCNPIPHSNSTPAQRWVRRCVSGSNFQMGVPPPRPGVVQGLSQRHCRALDTQEAWPNFPQALWPLTLGLAVLLQRTDLPVKAVLPRERDMTIVIETCERGCGIGVGVGPTSSDPRLGPHPRHTHPPQKLPERRGRRLRWFVCSSSLPDGHFG